MAAKKTATKKTGNAKRAKKTVTQVQRESAAATAPKYATIGDVARAASKGALPRGSKFVIGGGRAKLVAKTTVLFDGDAGDVALYGLRKAGFVASIAKGAA